MIALTAASLLLAACSGQDTPDGTGTTPATFTPAASATTAATGAATPDVTVTEPALPEAKPTPASAVAFVRYFWKAYNYAFDALEPRILEDISDPACMFCRSAIDDIRSLTNSTAQGSGGDVTVIEAASPPVKITTGTLVLTTVSQTPETVTQNNTTTTNPGYKSIRADFSVIWTGTGWKIEGVELDRKNGERWPA